MKIVASANRNIMSYSIIYFYKRWSIFGNETLSAYYSFLESFLFWKHGSTKQTILIIFVTTVIPNHIYFIAHIIFNKQAIQLVYGTER